MQVELGDGGVLRAETAALSALSLWSGFLGLELHSAEQ
jgi:16S rRNA U1498 N3-methylase RsmE